MSVVLYIGGLRCDLFKDESINIDLSKKNISDISKVFADFTQAFTIPATPANNYIFSHWYNPDVYGIFNANIRVPAVIEIDTIPFRKGKIQLENCKVKKGVPSSYTVTFYGDAVNLTDYFKDEELTALDLTAFDHPYDASVMNSINSNSIANGDIYYPLINYNYDMSYNSLVTSRNLDNAANIFKFTDFKPALRNIRIIEAIEAKYNITFSRDFFNRSLFYNEFMLLNNEVGSIKVSKPSVDIMLPNIGTLVGTITDGFVYNKNGNTENGYTLTVVPQVGFTTVPYTIEVRTAGDDILRRTFNRVGSFTSPTFNFAKFYFKIRATVDFDFQFTLTSDIAGTATQPVQSFNGGIEIVENLPKIKIKDYFNGLVKKYNLVIIPKTDTEFYIDTLDSWYEKGRAYDLTKYIKIDEIEVKRPEVNKLIEFKYKETETILGARFRKNFGIGYGDLRATYDIQGGESKIELPFENLMMERLQDEGTDAYTSLHAGYIITDEATPKPSKMECVFVYKNGLIPTPNYYIDGVLRNTIYHTSSEDNAVYEQVSNTLQFGQEISTFFLGEVVESLYSNFWKNYISELYDLQTRVLSIKVKLPTNIIHSLKLNDRVIISDKKYKINTLKIDLLTMNASMELYNDYSAPVDTVDNIVPYTVDKTDVTVDTTTVTVDKTNSYAPFASSINNGISPSDYIAFKGFENFTVKITANTEWTLFVEDLGFGTSWINLVKNNGNKSDYVRVDLSQNLTGLVRTARLRMTILGIDYYTNITQNV